ncbi:hypothetical protein BZA77DRAFT_314093 [Pyronema omphalodes]|nr:hypothetical protein BZA77DRAFT_314093 [Pyronema omphalodes]
MAPPTTKITTPKPHSSQRILSSNVITERVALSPADTSLDRESWPQMQLKDVTITNSDGKLVDWLTVNEAGPFRVVGRLQKVKEECQDIVLNTAVYLCQLEIPEFFTYSIQQAEGEDDDLIIWILGDCGWYTITPSSQWRPLFLIGMEKARLWLFIECSYISDDHYWTPCSYNRLERKWAAKNKWTLEEAEASFTRNHEFIIMKMLEFGGGWDKTSLWKWLVKKFPNAPKELQQRLLNLEINNKKKKKKSSQETIKTKTKKSTEARMDETSIKRAASQETLTSDLVRLGDNKKSASKSKCKRSITPEGSRQSHRVKRERREPSQFNAASFISEPSSPPPQKRGAPPTTTSSTLPRDSITRVKSKTESRKKSTLYLDSEGPIETSTEVFEPSESFDLKKTDPFTQPARQPPQKQGTISHEPMIDTIVSVSGIWSCPDSDCPFRMDVKEQHAIEKHLIEHGEAVKVQMVKAGVEVWKQPEDIDDIIEDIRKRAAEWREKQKRKEEEIEKYGCWWLENLP